MQTQIIRAHPIGPAPVAYYGECRDCRTVSPAFADPVPAIGWVQPHVAAEHPDLRGRPIARMTDAELCVAATRVAVRRKICTVACGQRRPGGWSVDAAAFAQAMQDPDVIAYAASLVGEAPADPDQRVPVDEARLRAILVDLMEAKGEPEAAQEYAHAKAVREARDLGPEP